MPTFPKLAPTNCALGPKFPKGWDLIRIGGNPLPGRARVLSGGTEVKFDPKHKPGVDGNNPTFLGAIPRKVEIEISVWTDEQLAALSDFLVAYDPNGPAAPVVDKVDAPALRHITSLQNMVCVAIGPIERAPDLGVSGRKVKMDWCPWDPPALNTKSKVKTPKQPAPPGGPTNFVTGTNAAATNQVNSNPPPNHSVTTAPPAGPVR